MYGEKFDLKACMYDVTVCVCVCGGGGGGVGVCVGVLYHAISLSVYFPSPSLVCL